MLSRVRSADDWRIGSVRVGDSEGVREAPGEGADGSLIGAFADRARVGDPRGDGVAVDAGSGYDKVGKVQTQL